MQSWEKYHGSVIHGPIDNRIMSIISKYLTREILKLFAIILAMVVGIYVIVDFFEKVDDFLERGVPLTRAVLFFLFKIPFIFSQILPVCVLLSVLVVFGLMNKNNEIVALKSSGVSVYHLFKPVLILGILFSLLMFTLTEVVVPITMAKANVIWLKEVRNEPAVLTRERNIWIRGNQAITHIKFYHSARKTMMGLTLNRFDKNFRLTRRIDAERGVFDKGRWMLFNVMEQHLEGKYGKSRMKYHDQLSEKLEFFPDDLKHVAKKSEEMNYTELKELILKVEAEGYDATAYKVDLNSKIAFPLVCVIMCLIGTGIALKGQVREGLPAAIAYWIGIAFLYWIFFSFCISLGYGEMLPPFVAAWVANLVFLCFGIFTLLGAE